MPTGYTAKISKGEQTTKEYIIGCIGAFIRDDSSNPDILKEEFKPDTYHQKQANEYELELTQFLRLSNEEIQQQIDIEHKQRIESRNKYTIEKLETKDRYESALRDIRKWNIPSAEHKNLKDFCISQLEESIKYDCNMNYIETISNKPSVEDYKISKKSQIKKDIQYHKEEYAKEIKRTNEWNLWLKQLRDSLNDL